MLNIYVIILAFIGACAVGIALVFYLAYRLKKHLDKKKNTTEEVV